MASRIALLVGLLVAIGCGGKDSTPNEGGGAAKATVASTVSAAARAEADTVWTTRCVGCHGAEGDGSGAAAAALTPKPRDLRDAAWQQAATDEKIEKVIREGGPAVGLSPLMPPNPDLASKPDVITALREKIRALR